MFPIEFEVVHRQNLFNHPHKERRGWGSGCALFKNQFRSLPYGFVQNSRMTLSGIYKFVHGLADFPNVSISARDNPFNLQSLAAPYIVRIYYEDKQTKVSFFLHSGIYYHLMWLWLFLFLLYFNCVILDGYILCISVMYSTVYVSLTCNLMLNYLLYTRKKKSSILTSVTHFYICTNREGVHQHVASFPSLPCLLFWFAFSVIHRSRRLAAILNTNQRAK